MYLGARLYRVHCFKGTASCLRMSGPNLSASTWWFRTAARVTQEGIGLQVTPQRALGARVHPKTGREIHYIACRPVGGEAVSARDDEVAGLAWAARSDIP